MAELVVNKRIFVPGPSLSREAVETWTPMQKKPSTVYMKRIVDAPFEVETNEDTVSARPGDYVAHDPKSGHFWPVSAEYVAMHYEEE